MILSRAARRITENQPTQAEEEPDILSGSRVYSDAAISVLGIGLGQVLYVF